MRNSPRITAPLILQVISIQDEEASATDTELHDLGRLLRYRLAVLEAALRRVDELQREAGKALLALPCSPSIH
jgi:hypothetical protein